jgi:hypothetical protein
MAVSTVTVAQRVSPELTASLLRSRLWVGAPDQTKTWFTSMCDGLRRSLSVLSVLSVLLCCGSLASCAAAPAEHALSSKTTLASSTKVLPCGAPCTPAGPVSDTLPGGQALPAGAQFTSVVQYQNHYVAAGSYFPGGGASAIANCSVGCNPVVWTSTNENQWSVTWTVPATGSIAGEDIVASPTGLLLFNDDEGTSLWRSTNTLNWQKVPLPTAMEAFDITKAVWSHNRFVAILRNKFAGGPDTAYGESDAIWTSTGGVTWDRDTISGPPAHFQSLSADTGGFVIGSGPTVWTSSDGISWTKSTARIGTTPDG